jgi:hypothetical protein
MNETQLMWIEIIHRVITAPRFDLKKGDLDYVLRNMLAKHTSSQDVYSISVGIENLILSDTELKTAFEPQTPINLRKFFYGKKSKAFKLGSPAIFEHSIPAAVLRGELLKVRQRYWDGELNEESTFRETTRVLSNCGEVALILQEENRRLSRSTMPQGWVFGQGEVFARYKEAVPPVLISKRFKAYRNDKICR